MRRLLQMVEGSEAERAHLTGITETMGRTYN